jgi:protein-L-isoaspartate(D-aspartate) O-methyltransferase
MRDTNVRRDHMVDQQIAARGISDPRVLDAMRRVPREAFLPKAVREFAYDDSPLPIAEGQTISQPYVVALMIQAAEIGPGDRVLEIGAGSGYAAAVVSRIADHVYAVERHDTLAAQARAALAGVGYDNVEIRHGDGSHGWPEADPFDAILVSCGAPAVPDDLREQLAIGGRLIIPVGDSQRRQVLVKIVRAGEDSYSREDFGEVAFVPLVGEHGWPEKKASAARSAMERIRGVMGGGRRKSGAAKLIAEAAEPLPDIDDPAFAEVIDRFADARVVMLGEATHGTSEFYRARAAMTRRLIETHGFSIVAVEADWPDAKSIDRYVRHLPQRPGAERTFQRFPQWMWRNHEVHEFTDWLRRHNESRAPADRTGFFGLDLYSLDTSIREVLAYLDEVDPDAARVARERYGCLTPWQKDPAVYGRAALTTGYAACEKAVLKTLGDVLARRFQDMTDDAEGFLDAAQNARLVAAAERYYRVMYYGSRESWNLRDRHMFDTLKALLDWRGPQAKAVVWAHNTHVGDASATEMGVVREEVNIGCLSREKWPGEVRLIGFGTDHGTVAAATDWGGPMELKRIQPSAEDSYERLCLNAGVDRFFLDMREEANPETRLELMSPRLERAIGVIYRPETELLSHYYEASLPQQFDAWVWFAGTHAVAPLPAEPPTGLPDTYPFGL